jgi:hypothetical protein
MAAALETLARIAHGPTASAEAFPWAALRYQHTQGLRTALAARYAPSTANRQLSALRGVLREAWRLGAMTAEHYRRAADLEPVHGERLPAGREVTAGELRALFVACREDTTPAGARDAALLAILYGGGLHPGVRRTPRPGREGRQGADRLCDERSPGGAGGLAGDSRYGTRSPSSPGRQDGSGDRAPDDGPGRALHSPEASCRSSGRTIHPARSSAHLHLPSSRRWGGSRDGAAPRGSFQCDDYGAVRSKRRSCEASSG